MKHIKPQILFFVFLLSLVGCIKKSQFDATYSPYYNLPWNFSITSYTSTMSSIDLTWEKSSKALHYSVLYKDQLDSDYTTASTDATSPYTLSGLTLAHTYLVKVVADGSYGVKSSNVINVLISTPPVAVDVLPANILAGTARTITLTYSDAESDLATTCDVSALDGLTVSSPCQCVMGICEVGVTGASGSFGSAEFQFTVTANNQISNSALVTFDYICPSGYISISGDASLGVSGFCVMEFEAKNVASVPTSQALLSPWNNMTMPEAKSSCEALGSKYALISNPEWMTIARGIETNALNWSGGSVNTGLLNSGHSDSITPNDFLTVTNIADPYNGTGNSSLDLPGFGWEQKRTHTVLNGNIIWDFAGNVNEWIDWTITPTNKAYKASDGAPLVTPIEFLSLDTFITSTSEMFLNSWQATNPLLTSTARIGCYTAGSNLSGGYARRGGMWSSQTNAGIYALDLSSTMTSAYNDTGFRCVYRP